MTSADEAHLVLPPRTTYLVKQLELAIRAGMDAIAGEFGVTALQYTALSVLARHPGLSAAQMAHRSFVSPQAGNEMVKILEKKGLITRTPDACNRHIKRINLTAAGRAVLSQCDVRIDRLEARMLGEVTPADTAVLRRALGACLRSLAS
ncbi:MAG TPA: MarR family transcriptional regulator [Trebonia sp.]|jgi:DNA-binding MarR family transcriptional regulator|nr:MarR family transcriptional regulator [Trebonia sp.]